MVPKNGRRIESWLVVLAALLIVACRPGSDAGNLPPPPSAIPVEYAAGAGAFERHCASCHGEYGRGTAVGPPLVHPYYVPSHHSDLAFQFAVQRGVAAHHWRFGDMPPQPQVTPSELELLIAYVRWLQQEAGIR